MLSASEWLRTTFRDPLWRVTPDQFRIAMALVAMADVKDGTARVSAPSSDFERFFGMTRGKFRRALAALEASGFCQVWASKGRNGLTQVILRDLRAFSVQMALPIINRYVQDAELLCDSSADHGERGHSADHLKSSDSDKLDKMITESRARDQDLQRSPSDQDLRSSDLQDLTSTEKQKSTFAGMAGWVDGRPESTDQDRTTRFRIDVSSIPDRAWAAADYLRAQVLLENPVAFVGRKPWENGWDYPVDGKPKRLGEGSRTGLRLAWAHGFRLLHGKVAAALRSADPAAGDAEAWAEIARTVRWLFREQPVVGPRFVVEAPDSLTDKWDNIQRIRINRARAEAVPKPARGADNRPDRQAERAFKRWDDA